MIDSRQDWELLQDYTEHGSQAAFASLVERYVHFVYSVCRREVRDPVLAEDVTQVVFLLLAKKAPTLGAVTVLSGWLFNTARFASKSALRQETRRIKWEQKAATDMLDASPRTIDAWDDIEPLLNEALTMLSAAEREAVLLRFFEGKSLREASEMLGVSESGVSKRIARAVDKLRAHFGRHGFALSALVLAGLIRENAVQAAPASCLTAAMQLGWSVKPGLLATELAATQTASVKAASLCQGVLRAMLLSKLQSGAVAMLAMSLMVAGGNKLARLSLAHSADLSHTTMKQSALVRAAAPARLATISFPHRRSLEQAKPARHRPADFDGAPAARLTRIGLADSGAPQPDAKPVGEAAPGIQPGEIRLTGTIQAITPAANRLVLTVDVFTLPNGKTNRLATPKAKTVILNDQTALYVRQHPQEKVALQQIPLGASAIIVGQDAGTGTALTARAVQVWNVQDGNTFRLGPPSATQLDQPAIAASGFKNPAAPLKLPMAAVETGDGKAAGAETTRLATPQLPPGPRQIEIQIGHFGNVRAFAFSPDSKILATAGGDRVVKLWDMDTLKLRHTLTGHTQAVVALAFSPDGKTVASGGAYGDGTVKLWDVTTGDLRQTIPADAAAVTAVAFLPQGFYLATAGLDGSIKLWNAETAEPLKTLAGHAGAVETLAFSPDSKVLASGGDDKLIKLWDVHKFKLLQTLPGHTQKVSCLAFAPNNRSLASGSADATVKIWDLATGAVEQTLIGHTGEVQTVSYAADGQTLASAQDSFIRLWNTATGQPRNSAIFGHRPALYSPDGQIIACGDGNSVWLWQADPLPNAPRRITIKGNLLGSKMLNDLAYAPDGKTLAVASWNGTVQLWDLQTGELRQVLTAHGNLVSSVAFSPDGSILASAGDDKTVRLWSAQTGAPLRTLQGAPDEPVMVGDRGGSRTLAFSADGQLLANARGDGTVKLWNVQTGALEATLTGHKGYVRAIAYAPDGRHLASLGGSDKTIKLWDVQTGQAIYTLNDYPTQPYSLAFTPDGKYLVVGGFNRDTGLQLRDAATGALKTTLRAHLDPIRSIAVASDSQSIATAAQDGIRLWNVATGLSVVVGAPGQYQGLPFSVAFGPDGKTLATTGLDGIVRLWLVDNPAGNGAVVRQLATLIALPVPARPNLNVTLNMQPQPATTGWPYLTYTPDGYYTGSPTVDQYLQWRVNGQSFPAAPFKAALCRPDLVQQSLRPPQ